MQIVQIFDRHVINKCIRRIWEAEHLLRDLIMLQQSPAADTFETTWLRFLVALNSVPEILKTGSKRHPKSRQWFARKDRLVRQDPLLSYLFHSRGADFHGDGRLFKLMISRGTYEYQEYSLKDEPSKSEGEFHIPEDVDAIKLWYEFQTVFDHRGNSFDPPTTHLGGYLNTEWPTSLGYTALFFYQSLIQEASDLA